MQPDPKVMKALEDILAAELAAVNTYFIQAKLQENWGYARLAKHTYDESLAEMRHAEKLVDRIVYFDGIPNLNKIGRVRVGETVREQMVIDLELEVGQVTRLNEAIAITRTVGDDGTRLVFEPMVEAGEESVDWLETQISAIDALGETTYLAQQLHE
jgi:bacterioferritin